MKLQTMTVSAVAAFLLGLLQAYLLILCWGYINSYSSTPHWLIGLGLHGASLSYTLLCLGLIINMLLSLPAAFVLLNLRPARFSQYVSLAVLPSSAWLNRMLVNRMYDGNFFGPLPLGWLPATLALPVAAWLLWLVSRHRSPINSFKADASAPA